MKFFLTLVVVLTGIHLASAQCNSYSLRLNGSQWFERAHTSQLDPTDLTIETWILLTSAPAAGNFGVIAAKYDNNTNIISDAGGYLLALDDQRRLYGVIQSATVNVNSQLTGSQQIPLNVWTHVAMTYSSGSAITFYINGVQDAQLNSGVEVMDATTNKLQIGRLSDKPQASYNWGYLTGNLDELRIWNTALPQSTLAAWRTYTGGDAHPAAANLIANYRVITPDAAFSADGTTNALHLTAGNGATSQGTAPAINSGSPAALCGGTNGLLLDGVDDWVDCGGKTVFNYGTMTVSAWVSFTSGSTGMIVNKYLDGVDNGYRIYASNGHVYAFYKASAANRIPEIDAGLVNDGVWHHITYTVDNTGGKLYIDGTLKGSAGWMGTATACTTSESLRLGRAGGTDGSYFTGSIDQVAISNTALPAGAVRIYRHYSSQGFGGWWRFNTAGATVVPDEGCSYGNSSENAAVYGNPAAVTTPVSSVQGGGTNSSAIVLNGSAYLAQEVASSPSYSPLPLLTAQGWFKSSAQTGTRRVIMAKGAEWVVAINAADKLEATFYDAAGTPVFSRESDYPVRNGVFHHVAAVFQTAAAAEDITLYLDGVQQNSVLTDNRATLNFAANPAEYFTIGAQLTQAGGFVPTLQLDGVIDDVSVYDTAVSETAIRDWRNTPQYLFFSSHPAGTHRIGGFGMEGIGCNLEYNFGTGGDWLTSSGTTTTALMAPVGSPGAYTCDGRSGNLTGVAGVGAIIPAIAPFDLSTAYTVELWAKIPVSQNYTTTPENILLEKAAGSLANFYIQYNNTGVNAGKISAGFRDGSWSGLVSPTNLNDNKWHHLALIKTATTVSLLVDGAVVATATLSPGSAITNGGSLSMGMHQSGTAPFTGNIDEVRIWNAALPASTVANWYNQTITTDHPDYAALVAAWNWDEAAADARGLYDYGPNRFSGESWAGRSGTGAALNRPRVTTLTAAAPRGNTITVNGFGLGGAGTRVQFGQVWALASAGTPTSLTVPVPSAANGGAITVMPQNNTCNFSARSALAFAPVTGCAVTLPQTSFSPWANYTLAGNASYTQVLADFTGLGLPGKAVGLSTFFYAQGGTRDGGSNSVDGSYSSGYSPSAVDMGAEDFDGDGRSDVYFTSQGGGVQLLQQSSNPPSAILVPGSATPAFFPSGTPRSVCTGDADNDGRIDLIISTSTGLYVYLNTTTGGAISFNMTPFAITLPLLPGAPTDRGKVRAHDFDGDGKTDLLVSAQYAGGWVTLRLRGSGTGGTPAFTSFSNTSGHASGVEFELLDYNSDGYMDYVFSDPGNNLFMLYTNTHTGGPSFSGGTQVAAAYSMIRTLDVNGDGIAEILGVAPAFPGSMQIISATDLLPVDTVNIAENITHITGGDLNGDGFMDLALMGAGSNSPRYYFVNSSKKVPQITSITPAAARPGESILITGTNFGAAPGDNTVLFGVVRGVVTAASATSLTVTIPAGATDGSITVTNNCGLSGSSLQAFTLTTTGCGTHSIASTSFASPFNLSVAPGNTYVYLKRLITADLNRDGRPDIVEIGHTDPTSPLNIIQNNHTSGTLSASSFATGFVIPGGYLADEIQAVDMDRDGNLDLVMGSNYTATIIRNTNSGGNLSSADFEPSFVLTAHTGTNGQPLVIADMDLDGRPDIITSFSGRVLVYRNISSPGSLSAKSFTKAFDYDLGSTYYSLLSIAAGDLTGDGFPEIVVGHYNTPGTLFVFRNSASGTTFASPFSIPVANTLYGIELDDVDADGKKDIVTIGGPTIFRNLYTSGTFNATSFASPVVLTGGGQALMEMADLDGDGKRDIIATINYSGKTWQNLSTPGNISFGAMVTTNLAYPVRSIWADDLDGDGRKELLGSHSSTLQILRNTSAKAYSALNTATVSNAPACNDGVWQNIYNPANPSQILMAINPNGLDLGTVSATSYVDAGPGTVTGTYYNNYYAARHWKVSTTNAPAGTKTVRLYFTTAEFNALNAADPSIITLSDLRVFKYNGPTEDGTFYTGDATSKTTYSGAQLTFGTQYGVNYVQFDVPSFSEFWLTGDQSVILPVELVRFSAAKAGEDVHLGWRTASEKGSDYFGIERSTDGKAFAEIGRVAAQGNTSAPADYRFQDAWAFRAAGAETLWYRLRQVDENGDYSYTEVRRVDASGAPAFDVRLYPNPAHDVLHVEINAPGSGSWQVNLRNVTGTVVRTGQTGAGGHTLDLSLKGLPGGVYLAEISDGVSTRHERVSVQ